MPAPGDITALILAGGFGTRNKPGWKPKLLVLVRD